MYYNNHSTQNPFLNQPPPYSQVCDSSHSSANSYPTDSLRQTYRGYSISQQASAYPSAPQPPCSSGTTSTLTQALNHPLSRDFRSSYSNDTAIQNTGVYPPYGPSNGIAASQLHHNASAQTGTSTLPKNSYVSDSGHRLKTVDEHHRIYRGGFRPMINNGTGGMSTMDGLPKANIRGLDSLHNPERETLLSGDKCSPHSSVRSSVVFHRKEGEKQPFIGAVEPVKLTPSWEQRDVSKEELNLKNVNTFEPFEMDAEPPRDRLALVFLILTLHGIGTLMPWNMFITAKNYFVNYKFGTATVDASVYTTNFLPYLGYASQVPNVLFNWINIFVQLGGNLTTRIVGSIVIEVIIFILTVILAMVDSSEWPGLFFWTTMVSVVILNTANGIYQNTIYGLAARLPFKYTGAVVLGSNISGTFTALINIIAIAMAPNQRTSAIYYFITALFILLACFDTYFALPLNRFFRYHEHTHARAQLAAKRTPGKARTPFWHIFKCAFPQLFNVFMVFFVTLSVFPAVLADTCRTEENFFISPKYFQAVTCFLTFNLFAMIGNMIPGLVIWPGPKFLCIPVLLRLLFIPAFVLCHYYPYAVIRTLPVLIDSDWVYWVLTIFLGITSGYYSSLAMMYCPRTVEPEYAHVAGMMGAASLITGIFAGINFQVVCSYVVTRISLDMPGFENTFRNCTDRSLIS